MTKKIRNVKNLYAGAYDVHGGGILVVQSKNGRLRLVGGRIALAYIRRKGSELYKRSFISSKIREKTGLIHLIKNDEPVLIQSHVQPLPATYDVVRCYEAPKMTTICEYSAVIIGEVDYSSLKKPQVFFIDFRFLREQVLKGNISLIQEILMLRIMASRENPNRFEARRAGKELKKKH
jgi:hypothetical protein